MRANRQIPTFDERQIAALAQAMRLD